MTGAVIKYPIGRVVREHRIGLTSATPELEAINQAAISMRRAITSLRRQEATLNSYAARARKKVTPEQHVGIDVTPDLAQIRDAAGFAVEVSDGRDGQIRADL